VPRNGALGQAKRARRTTNGRPRKMCRVLCIALNRTQSYAARTVRTSAQQDL